MGKNLVYLGEDGILRITCVGDQDQSTAMEMAEEMQGQMSSSSDIVGVLFDTAAAGRFTVEARQVAAASLRMAAETRVAIVAPSAPMRALAFFIKGGHSMAVFDTRREALRWLKEQPGGEGIARRRIYLDALWRAVSRVRWLRITERWLKDVFEVLENVAMGDFSRRIAVSSGEDELALIEAGINIMVDDLEDRHREAIEYERRLWEYSQQLERKVAERTDELRQSEARYRGLFEGANDIIVSIDPDAHIEDINRKGSELLGFTREEMVGMNLLDDLVSAPSRDSAREAMAGVIAEGSASGIEAVFVTRGGGRINLEISASAHCDGGGVSGMTFILRDTTERKRAEEEILRHNRELAFMEERNRIARELHDSVSQLLFSLVLNAETAGVLVESDPGQAMGHIQSVRQVANRAQEKMRTLLTELRLGPLEGGLCVALKEYVSSFGGAEGIDVTFLADGGQPLDAPLERELFRVAQEAMNNIAKHSRARSATIELGYGQGTVRLTVEDDGVGFDPASPQAMARGLGLTIMRERVQGLSGRMDIESQPGRGTRIVVEVPLEGRYGRDQGPDSR